MNPRLHQFAAPDPVDPETGISKGSHRIAYTEWGAEDNPNILVCVHGLTRNSRDFDYLAHTLENKYRVFCLDVAGRGRSSWLENKQHYSYATYVADILSFLVHIKAQRIDWVGTSMGGLIGMILAAYHPGLIRTMVLNDIGPFIPAATLKRIVKYVGVIPDFTDMAALEKHLRTVLAPFGITKDADWAYLARHSAMEKGDGALTLAYDPAIAGMFSSGDTAEIHDVDLWNIWDMVTCRTLVLRGALSDALLAETAEQMTKTGPKAALATFPNIGHAPALMAEDQIAVVRSWLLEVQS